MKRVTRFAPSPTGYLHVGHAYSASLAYRQAVESDGHFLLRIEDIDGTRCRSEFEQGIYEDLNWLGLKWEEPVRRQSEQFEDYAAILERLSEENLIYPCFCTRREIAEEIARSDSAPHGPDGPLYHGTCKQLSDSEREKLFQGNSPYALRLDMDKAMAVPGAQDLTFNELGKGQIACNPAKFGDIVLARKETPTSYHLAVTFDDALQGVNLVVRGQDLFEATHVQRLLQHLLQLPVPDYLHHGLVSDTKGRRLAKRDKGATIRSLREKGYTPEEVMKLAGFGKN
ncbi:MAG: tRNA glutamyl-Q(34) synthetase GluQRS [Sneathiellales bacterium]|nr:tRNA glutamyl-Q(34) synthetase GluQRS [Sneathiellales bacterium]